MSYQIQGATRLNHSALLVPNRKTTMGGFAVKSVICAILLFLSSLAHAEPAHHCTNTAMEQAKKLLVFHAGSDNRIEIDKSVKKLVPIRNPANKKQLLD